MTKRLLGLSAIAAMVLFLGNSSLFATNVGDYRSVASGNWSATTTWNTWNGSAWVAAATVPDSTQAVAVEIVSPDNVTYDLSGAGALGVRNVTVDQGATLTIAATPVVMYVTQEGVTVNGTLTITGNVATAAPYGVTKTTGTLTISSTGVVNINETAASTSTKGYIPTATWATGSTLNVNSTGGTGATGLGSGGSQNFGNINYNVTVGNTGNLGWGFGPGNVVSGNFVVSSTNSGTTAGRLQLFGGSSGSLRILGNLVVSGGNFTGCGSGTSATYDSVFVMGNVRVTTGGAQGYFAVDKGSHGSANDGSGVVWYFYGDSVTIATTSTNSNNLSNSNGQASTYPYYLDSRFVLAKAGTQYVKIAPTTCTSTYGLNFDVINGSQVNIIATSNIIYLRLINGKIISPTATPLISGWYTGTALYSGTIENTSTSYVSGNLGILVATTSPVSKTFPIGKGSAYRPVTLSLTPSAATNSTFYAEMFNAGPPVNALPGTLNNVSSVRYYNIAEAGGGAAFTGGTLKILYGSDDGVATPSDLRVAQGPSGSGTWVDLGGPGSGTGTSGLDSITTSTSFTDLTTNTVFALASSLSDNPLPVEVTDFAATVQSGSVTLNWKTGSEINNAGFNVWRKGTGDADFVMVSSYLSNSALKGLGTSSVGKAYSFTDKNANESGNYIYKLESVSTAGTSKLFTQLDVTVAVPKQFALFQNYPNPFNPTTVITYDVPKTSMVTIEVYDLLGNKIGTLVNETKAAGEYVATFDGSRLASGVYLYRMSTGNYSSVKKLLLMK